MKKRIITVDNMSVINKIYKLAFGHNGYDVVWQAVNGKEAIEKFFVIRPDIMVLDINMPVMNGIEALKEIMRIDPEAKIVMCTSECKPRTMLECILYGASGYVVKPFNQEVLVAIVESVLNEKPVYDKNTIKQYLAHEKVKEVKLNDTAMIQEDIEKLLELCKGDYMDDPLDFL